MSFIIDELTNKTNAVLLFSYVGKKLMKRISIGNGRACLNGKRISRKASQGY
jgi:hypothetical protein